MGQTASDGSHHRPRCGRTAAIACAITAVFIVSVGATLLVRVSTAYGRLVDRRLSGEVYSVPARIYAEPRVIRPGDRVSAGEIVNRLRRAGFRPDDPPFTEDGVYQVATDGSRAVVAVSPEDGPDYQLEFGDGRLVRASEVSSPLRLGRVELPAELVTGLFDDTRSKRRLAEWAQIPPHLIDAILASEDRRFYRHFGVDLIRGVGAAYANFRGKDLQGASTVTMQLAGSVFLDRGERTWSRKLSEILLALLLERRLTKQQILLMYVNEMYLGNRGSFAINGFGEAASAYFDKDIADLTLSEAAMLVGMLPAPNAYAPTRNLERSVARRDAILRSMYELGMIGADDMSRALEEEPVIAAASADERYAPYMVDYVRSRLLDDFSEPDLLRRGLRVYTTLDPDLQRAAVEAIELGITGVEARLESMGRGPSSGEPPVQAALIALDPHTGAIKAMVGGREYGASQYNRITEAFRQPGSVFKPFVYAAAFETAFRPLLPSDPRLQRTGFANDLRSLSETPPGSRRPRRVPTRFDTDGRVSELDAIPERLERGTIRSDSVITPLTTLSDAPTYFLYGEDRYYRPDNFGSVFHGLITVREALERSLNVPTVKIAERVGYDRVVELAHRAGLNGDIRPYPAVALGSFEVTPIEIAGAWTAFANRGVRVEPRAIDSVRSADGELLASYRPDSRQVLRPELAALMTSLLEGVINGGSGVGVRTRGFTLPAAGKTGTSRDGWFAGYTTDLLAIVWVGFDDSRELDLAGSQSALPIWTAFMMEAERVHPDRDDASLAFPLDPGVETVWIDGASLSLAGPDCIDRFSQAFIRGTAPTSYCPIHGGGDGFFLGEAFKGIGRALQGLFRQ